MLQSISWGDFIRTSTLLTSLYYLIIGIRYFRKEFSALILRLRKKFLLMLTAIAGLTAALMHKQQMVTTGSARPTRS